MSLRNNADRKAGLALAIASGGTVAAWARKHDVPTRTAYTWSRSPEVRRQVARIRRRAIDRAVGQLTRHATAAANQIARLARESDSDAVKLQASRAVLADLMAVANYATLERRLAALEGRVDRAAGQGTPDGLPTTAAAAATADAAGSSSPLAPNPSPLPEPLAKKEVVPCPAS
jgi:transposase-like protein